MPQYSLPIVVDSQSSIGNASVYVDMLIPRTVTVDNPPDYTWTFVDSNNHWHAYNNKGELPTLDAVQGTGPIAYFCKICRQPITPATLPGPVDVTVNIRPAWAARVTLNTLPTVGERVIVRATPPVQPTNFGVASVDSYTGTGPYVVDVIGETAISVMKA